MEDINLQSSDNKRKIHLNFKDSKYATGRRKKSVARVWVKKGSGKIYVNGKDMKTCGHIGSICAGHIVTGLGSRSAKPLQELINENLQLF